MKDLTQPRYLVIADYPNSHYEIGQIIELSVPKDASGWDMVTLANNEEIMPKYPHLFRLLHWWEYRDEKEMPEYLKGKDGTVYKVHSYNIKTMCFSSYLHSHYTNIETSVPATLNEYNEYIKSLSLIKTIENE